MNTEKGIVSSTNAYSDTTIDHSVVPLKDIPMCLCGIEPTGPQPPDTTNLPEHISLSDGAHDF